MSYQPVDVVVKDLLTRDPVQGVNVHIYDEAGAVFYTDGITNADGVASFLLWTRKYSARFYKFQVRFRQPQVLEVVSTPGANVFDVGAERLSKESSRDPLLCRASGFFRDITGAPDRYVDVIFVGEFAPILLDGSGVLSARRAIRTDRDGWACIDLIRCAKYAATVQGYEDQTRQVYVPDSPSVSLPELLFPTVDSVSFDLSSPWTLSVGSTLEVKPFVLTSTGIPLPGLAPQDVRWSVRDPQVASLTRLRDKLQLKGLKAGSTELVAERIDQTIVTIPSEPEISGSGVAITVT